MNNTNPIYLLETIIGTRKVKEPIKYTLGLLKRQTEVPFVSSHKSARKLSGEVGELARRMKKAGSFGVTGRKSGLVLKYMMDPSIQSRAEKLYSILSKLPASASDSLPKEYWASINKLGAYKNGFEKEAIMKLLQKRFGKNYLWPYNDVVAALDGFSKQSYFDYIRNIHTY